MPRPARPWFRFYSEAFADRKLRRLTPTQRWVWVAILGAARESPTPGQLLIAPGLPMTADELAEYAAVKPREVTDALPLMRTLGMISDDGDTIVVTNWEGRQFEADNVTARTQAYRERSKGQRRNVPTNVPEGVASNVRRNTPDTETEEEPPLPPDGGTTAEPSDSDRFDEFWAAYPSRGPHSNPKKPARAKYARAIKHTDPQVLIDAAAAYARLRAGQDPQHTAMATTWINQERWADQETSNVHELRPDTSDAGIQAWVDDRMTYWYPGDLPEHLERAPREARLAWFEARKTERRAQLADQRRHQLGLTG